MNIPRHVAIIMDGNGRWARKKNLPNIMGHREGVKTASAITEACARDGVKALTLYTFSTENWKRPPEEVDSLMSLFEKNLKSEGNKLHENGIRFNCIGRLEKLPVSLRNEIRRVMDLTAPNEKMTLTLAVNYGSRQEIVDAARAICREAARGGVNADSFDENDLGKFLYTNGLPELDLMIRTSGEMRLSNFLLWQAAYAELYVTDVLWPDFKAEDLKKAFEAYSARDRRFGG